MAPPATRITAASAPGKVLLTGGYLVLDRAYSGLVLALDARMHVIVRQVQKEDKEVTEQANEESLRTDDSTDGDNVITVESPQFLDAIWKYKAEPQPNGGGIKITQQDDGPPNHFVATSLSFALTYIAYVTNAATFGNLHITILADNAYYSETATSTSTSLTSASTISTSSSSASATAANKANAQSKPSRFANFGVKLQDAHKTGLGSSAALVTALTSALVLHATVQPEDLPMMRGRLHNLAQAAHCAAQGKVGSGFDIAAAIYGSCCYRRFSPEILEGLGTEDIGKAGFAERLFVVVEDVSPDRPWDTEMLDVGIRLPRGMQMVLCDVDCGSQTPGMVRQVLKWREEHPRQAEKLWYDLQMNNDRLRLEIAHGGEIKRVSNAGGSMGNRFARGNANQRGSGSAPLSLSSIMHTDSHDSPAGSPPSSAPMVRNGASTNIHPSNNNNNNANNGNNRGTVTNFSAIASTISRTRFYLRTMTNLSRVPIEPPAQTRLLDRIIQSVDGVVGGVVPGAGGYDAIALLVHDDLHIFRALRAFLERWEEEGGKEAKEDDFGGRVKRVRLLNVAHGSEGLRHEKALRMYAAWLE